MLTDAWFWAFLAAVGWGACFGIVGTRTLGRSLGFGITAFLLAELPRLLLPLPFVSQPRLTLTRPARQGGLGCPAGESGLWHPGLPDYSPHPA